MVSQSGFENLFCWSLLPPPSLPSFTSEEYWLTLSKDFKINWSIKKLNKELIKRKLQSFYNLSALPGWLLVRSLSSPNLTGATGKRMTGNATWRIFLKVVDCRQTWGFRGGVDQSETELLPSTNQSPCQAGDTSQHHPVSPKFFIIRIYPLQRFDSRV